MSSHKLFWTIPTKSLLLQRHDSQMRWPLRKATYLTCETFVFTFPADNVIDRVTKSLPGSMSSSSQYGFNDAEDPCFGSAVCMERGAQAMLARWAQGKGLGWEGGRELPCCYIFDGITFDVLYTPHPRILPVPVTEVLGLPDRYMYEVKKGEERGKKETLKSAAPSRKLRAANAICRTFLERKKGGG